MRLIFPPFYVNALDPQLIVIGAESSPTTPTAKPLKSVKGKPAADRLLKTVKAKSKRGKILRWLLKSATIEATMIAFEISRQNVFSHLFSLHRVHGIGYTFSENKIKLLLPPDCEPADIFHDA